MAVLYTDVLETLTPCASEYNLILCRLGNMAQNCDAVSRISTKLFFMVAHRVLDGKWASNHNLVWRCKLCFWLLFDILDDFYNVSRGVLYVRRNHMYFLTFPTHFFKNTTNMRPKSQNATEKETRVLEALAGIESGKYKSGHAAARELKVTCQLCIVDSRATPLAPLLELSNNYSQKHKKIRFWSGLHSLQGVATLSLIRCCVTLHLKLRVEASRPTFTTNSVLKASQLEEIGFHVLYNAIPKLNQL